MENSKFLERKYPDLPGSRPVERAVQKKLRQGESGPATKESRVDAYLDRLEAIMKDQRGLAHLKYRILETYTTKQDEIPESYWRLQENIMRERGESGDWANATNEQRAELKRQNSEGVLADQRSSLEQWVDYFASTDSDYVPRNLKYWIFRNVLGLAEYDKEKKEFPKRSKGTLKQFPDINHEALAYVVDAIIKKHGGTNIEFEHDIQPDERAAFQTFLAKENFQKLYSWAHDLMNPIPEHLLPVTEGEWRKFIKGSDPMELVSTIRGNGTGWCTAGENTAKTQLQGGDFYVFYSLDDEGKPTIPRIAIRMQAEKIAEVRGVAYKQNLDPYMSAVLEEKLNEFPDSTEYLKKDSDMKLLTAIETKSKKGEMLTRDDLTFLYELEAPIEGFGYRSDPRIEELRDARDVGANLPVLFECTPTDIAHSVSEIRDTTKAYIGSLEPGIFDALPPTLEHVYTKFPEERIKFRTIELGTGLKGGPAFQKAIESRSMHVGSLAQQLLESSDFKVLAGGRSADLVEISVRSLGFTSVTRYDQICARAQQLGLDLCPEEVGPQLRLQYADQPLDEYLAVAMKAISDRGGSPVVFAVDRSGGGLWLNASDGRPDDEWASSRRFVFLRPRK